MRLWDTEQTGDVTSKTFFDHDTGSVITTLEQDAAPIAKAAMEMQKEFTGYKSEVANQVASIPVNLHYFWMNTENYDFTDFKTHPWIETVKKMKAADLSHFFTVPNGGYQ